MRLQRVIRSEIRWASVFLAYSSLVYVASALTENDSHFKALIDWHEIGIEWVGLQALCAVLLFVGSVTPRRSWLHIGLVLSSFVWLSITMVLKQDLESTPGAMLFPFFAAMSFALLIDDVSRRPCK